MIKKGAKRLPLLFLFFKIFFKFRKSGFEFKTLFKKTGKNGNKRSVYKSCDKRSDSDSHETMEKEKVEHHA